MKKITKFLPILFLTAFFPLTTSAQTTGGLSNVIARIGDLISAIVPVLIGLGVVYFIWGVVQYFIADNEEAKNTGRDRIIFGIIGLAIVISIWGLVAILNQTLGLGGSDGLSVVGPPSSVNNLVTEAQSGDFGCFSSFQNDKRFSVLLNYITCIISRSVIPFIFALAVVMFIWGAVKFFILNGGEEEKRTQGKQFMIWGLVALTVMISVWGIVGILGETFDISTGVLPGVSPSK